MAGSVLEPKDILEYSAHKGTMKAENRADRLAVLGFLGGAFISVGYLAYVRIVAAMPRRAVCPAPPARAAWRRRCAHRRDSRPR